MLWIVSEWPPFRWLRSCLFWVARPRLLRLRIVDAMAVRRSRHELATLDVRLCEDIGICPIAAGVEAARPVRGELSPWAPQELRDALAESRRPLVTGTSPPSRQPIAYRPHPRG